MTWSYRIVSSTVTSQGVEANSSPLNWIRVYLIDYYYDDDGDRLEVS